MNSNSTKCYEQTNGALMMANNTEQLLNSTKIMDSRKAPTGTIELK